jgi:hypothetical protein
LNPMSNIMTVSHLLRPKSKVPVWCQSDIVHHRFWPRWGHLSQSVMRKMMKTCLNIDEGDHFS